MREDKECYRFQNIDAPAMGTASCQVNELVLFECWAYVDGANELWVALSVRAVIYITLTFYHQANLDFPKESIHKHLSNFKLQAKLS